MKIDVVLFDHGHVGSERGGTESDANTLTSVTSFRYTQPTQSGRGGRKEGKGKKI